MKKMKTKHYCCIPNCPTYDTLDKFLRFPLDVEWRTRWIKAIPVKNWVIDYGTIICVHHFKNSDLAMYTKLLNGTSGKSVITRSSTPLIKHGALPSKFDNLINTSEPSEEVFKFRDVFELSYRDHSPETFGDVEGVDINDFLIDYYYVKQVFEVKLKNVLGEWKIQNGQDYLMFYTVGNFDIPQIVSSIKIDTNLCVTVCLNGREMDPADLTWAVPLTRKINRWSQLTQLLNLFGR
ncbi:uncharacterized protein LOC108734294 [Agrilus planipennis]|uniref:Uncharacterized protein LOC108734294 n=1 Tax=Agrilus planipennis TaxID=224129 RepID=A0A1W4WMD2_AGRPL|nr:uncharacterized protein LOC108734294 [Agrilus planipennis]